VLRLATRCWVVLLLAAMAGAGAPAVGARPELPPSHQGFVRAVLTDDGSGLRIRRTGDGRVVMRGTADRPGRLDWNRREVFRRPKAPSTGPQTSCATWVTQSRNSVQQGLAVRIRDHAGRVRAVTLTKNVEYGYYWVFNLLTWDTARTGEPWHAISQDDMSHVVGLSADELRPLPWRVCLRARGRTVQFKVWLPREGPEPSWRDAEHVRSARLPRGFAGGRPGWYAGHVPAGERMVYRGLGTSQP
jgi:hypothetical protein